MSDQLMAAIGELIEPISSWRPERDDPDGSFTYIDLSAVDQDAKVIAGARALPCAEAPSRARQLVRVGDVLVSTVRPNLNGVARVPPELDGATASTGFCVLRPRPTSLDGDYLFHSVKSLHFVSEMVRRATGASYPAVSDRIIAEFKLALPPLHEQRRIANILDKADDLRAKRRQALAQLDTLVQSIFRDMFAHLCETKSDCLASLGKYLTFITSGGRGWARFYSSRGKRFVRSLDVQMNRIGNEDAVYVVPPVNAEARRTVTKVGDVLLTITGSLIGRVAAVLEDLGESYVSQHVAILRIDPARLNPLFLSYYLSLDYGQRQIAKAQYGQSKPGLNFEQIRQFTVPIPPLEMQRKFVRILHQVEALRATQRDSLKAVNSLFASLQHRAFRGEL